jgi:hypothetical protein
MHKEIKLTKNLRIGIDTDTLGIAVGLMKDPLVRVTGIMFLTLYIAWKSNRLKGKSICTFRVLDNRTSIRVYDTFYRAVPHHSYNQRVLYVRDRATNTIIEYDHCAIIEDNGFKGALVYKPNSHKPEFYSPDEYYFFKEGDIVKGYIDGDEIKVLSIVD